MERSKISQDHIDELSRQSVKSICKCPRLEIVWEDMVRMQRCQVIRYFSCHTWNVDWVCLKVLVKLEGDRRRVACRCSHLVEYIIPQEFQSTLTRSSNFSILPSTQAYTRTHRSSREGARSKNLRVPCPCPWPQDPYN